MSSCRPTYFLPESDDPAPVVIKYYPYRKDDLSRGYSYTRAEVRA